MWQSQFEAPILDRGYYYYLSGQVKYFFIEEHQLTGQVAGSHLYTVKLSLRGQRITKADCNCPSAGEGKLCKHMAAVMFTYEKGDAPASFSYPDDVYFEDYVCWDEDEADFAYGAQWEESDDYQLNGPHTSLKVGKNRPDTNSLLASLSAEDLLDFVNYLMAKDARIAGDLLRYFNVRSIPQDLTYYQSQIEAIKFSHEADGYIDYYQGEVFVQDLDEFMTDQVTPLFKHGEYRLLIDIAGYLVEMTDQLDMDGSNGEHMEIMYWPREIFEKVINQANQADQDYAFKILIALANEPEGLGFREAFIKDMLPLFNDQTKRNYYQNP
ncbi:hypothetical protein AWM75_08435 [Aerococcus urinaehominis]|uniref:Uncharacterized protein n=1 Tax=Aerococcus urinaehominis TaxID=128944 RepID=A0A109RHJ8_9LACT|nr:SWIM zinc finger family protein [Aerococcus urinaehominis]AMB99996.1 hypothetical protein AWM75_08435 [Aerococcus urinaehominis]SDL82568.1 SWIM zinc finger [Aerococcus urinaehominis]